MSGAILFKKKSSLLHLDRHLSNNILQLTSEQGLKKIILPDFYEKPVCRTELIERFLKEWLTDKQIIGMGSWFKELLESYSIELLLHAQKMGIEKLLLQTDGNLKELDRRQVRNYPLTIVPQPIKPKKMKVDLEEIGGDLASDVKIIKVETNVI